MLKAAKPIISAFLIVIAAISLSAIAQASAKKTSELKPVEVYVEEVQPKSFYQELEYMANLRPFREVSVFSFIEGSIAKKHRENGVQVKPGQVIASVKNIAPGFSYSEHLIKAPIGGLITGFYQEVGSQVDKTSSVLSIADTSQWRVSVPMLQQDLPYLQQEHRVELKIQGLPKVAQGRLLRISPEINQVLGTTLVDFVFDRQELLGARPGMIGQLNIKHSIKESIGIANEYLLESSSKKKKYVYIMKDDLEVEQRWLETGVVREGVTEVTSGLTPGETIITQSPIWVFKKGQKVNPQKKKL